MSGPAGGPTTEPVRPRGSRVAPATAAIVVLAVVAFVAGYGVGGGGRDRAPGSPSGSAAATLATTSGGALQPGLARDDLRQAATEAAGEDAWAVCVVDSTPSCLRMTPTPAARDTLAALPEQPLASAQLVTLDRSWTGHDKVGVTGSHVVLGTGDRSSEAAYAEQAIVVRLDGPPGDQLGFLQLIRPDRTGGVYFDLGALAPSRYLVFVVSLVLENGPLSATPDPSLGMLDLRFQPLYAELAFEVSPSGSILASPMGGSPAP